MDGRCDVRVDSTQTQLSVYVESNAADLNACDLQIINSILLSRIFLFPICETHI